MIVYWCFISYSRYFKESTNYTNLLFFFQMHIHLLDTLVQNQSISREMLVRRSQSWDEVDCIVRLTNQFWRQENFTRNFGLVGKKQIPHRRLENIQSSINFINVRVRPGFTSSNLIKASVQHDKNQKYFSHF